MKHDGKTSHMSTWSVKAERESAKMQQVRRENILHISRKSMAMGRRSKSCFFSNKTVTLQKSDTSFTKLTKKKIKIQKEARM